MWNNFDLVITSVCWVPVRELGLDVAFFRLIRLARLFKILGRLKSFRAIINGLSRGLAAVGYVLALILLAYYVFAVVGTICFQRNDPFLFGSVGVSMLTLFRIATFEAWTNVVLAEYYGCKTQNWMVVSVSYFGIIVDGS